MTGGAGFIGSNLCRSLAADPAVSDVVAFDDLSTGFRDNLEGIPVEFVEGDMLDRDLLDDVVRGADAVVHLGARPSVPRSVADPMASHVTNTTGTLEVLEAARRSGDCQVIVASSSSVYGSNPVLPKREDLAARPLSPYAATKLAAESYALAWQHTYGMRTVAFRFFNVFGPHQAAGHAYAAVIPAFIDAALAGRPLTVHGDGTQTRDFTFVDTVCAVLADTVLRGLSVPDPLNLAFGSRTSLVQVITMLEGLLDTELEVDHQDNRPGDVPHSQADNQALLELFPDVHPTPLIDGLRATLDWFRSSQRTARSRPAPDPGSQAG